MEQSAVWIDCGNIAHIIRSDLKLAKFEFKQPDSGFFVVSAGQQIQGKFCLATGGGPGANVFTGA